MTTKTRRLISGAVGVVLALICMTIANYATAQTGYPVPERVQQFRRVFSLLMLPWCWLPKVCFTWGTTGITSGVTTMVTLGLLWGCVIGFITSRLLRMVTGSATSEL